MVVEPHQRRLRPLTARVGFPKPLLPSKLRLLMNIRISYSDPATCYGSGVMES